MSKQVSGRDDIVAATMLTGDDVFDVKAQSRKSLGKTAILATICGALADELARLGIHQADGLNDLIGERATDEKAKG